MARTPLRETDPPRVGSYHLLARLGAGGMGVVYLASGQDGRPVALKALRPEMADDAEFRTTRGPDPGTPGPGLMPLALPADV